MADFSQGQWAAHLPEVAHVVRGRMLWRDIGKQGRISCGPGPVTRATMIWTSCVWPGTLRVDDLRGGAAGGMRHYAVDSVVTEGKRM
jgi:hypothetical protein